MYAKTLYKPTRPEEWDERLRRVTKGKVPSFFQYAKGKTEKQVESKADGVVDRLYDIVQIYKFKFNASALGTFDYKMLMYNENIPYGAKEKKIVREFRRASSVMHGNSSMGIHDENNQYWEQVKELQKKMYQYGSKQYVVDVLVRGLFHEHSVRKKSAFWDCFGDVVYDNLMMNLPDKTSVCRGCGKRFPTVERKSYCPDCENRGSAIAVHQLTCIECGETFMTRNVEAGAVCPACQIVRLGKQKKTCIDCGCLFEIEHMGRPSNRCPDCRHSRHLYTMKERYRRNKISS